MPSRVLYLVFESFHSIPFFQVAADKLLSTLGRHGDPAPSWQTSQTECDTDSLMLFTVNSCV